ncbi:hypothetical protein HYT52_03475 [Candidatus Woesearchaeota archaeon]|nr:hypothetical protein [Candidatus Woesearchaeota archaeon]
MDPRAELRLRKQNIDPRRKAITLSALFNPRYDLSQFLEITPARSLYQLSSDSRPDLLIIAENDYQFMQRAEWTENRGKVVFNPERRWTGYAHSGRLHYEAVRPRVEVSARDLDERVIYKTDYDFFVLQEGKYVPIRHVRLPGQESSGLSFLQSLMPAPLARYLQKD